MLIGLNITVHGANLSATRPNKLVRDGRNQYCIQAEIDPQWDGLVPYVCFTYGEETCQVKLEDGTAIIPDDVLAAGEFQVGVCGVGESATYVTNLLSVFASKGPDVDAQLVTEATPTIWESYLLQVDAAAATATEAAQQATAAVAGISVDTEALQQLVDTAVEATEGITGATFTPSVAENGDLSWSNDKDLENPTTVNLKGETGETGATGAQGEKGDAGEQGLQGEQGIQGETGATGATGAAGTDGASAYEIAVLNGYTDTEVAWLLSLKGETGDTGATGADGSDFTILDIYGSYEALSAAIPTGFAGDAYAVGDADNNVIYIWSDLATDWVSIGNMQGIAGTDGADGQDGADGVDGVVFTPSVSAEGELSWSNDGGVANPETVNIKGVNGADGADGASGYEVAVANGFSGSEAEWLLTLKGADGADGADGQDGQDGLTTSITLNDTTYTVDGSGNVDLGAVKGGVYDVIVRTQEEFEALIASEDWLGAVSVCFVGDGGTLEFTATDSVLIPATVKNIQGLNQAIIHVSDDPDSETGAVYLYGMYYEETPSITDGYWMDGITAKATVGNYNTSGNSITYRYGFYQCTNMTNCYGYGFSYGAGTKTGFGAGIYNCAYLVNCYGLGDATTETGSTSNRMGYGIYSCSYLSNCSGEGSSSILGGSNTYTDSETVETSPVVSGGSF